VASEAGLVLVNVGAITPHDLSTWAEMSAKLNLMGGLYIYRDGTRR